MSIIYALVDPRNKHAKYVGCTKNIKARLCDHCSNYKDDTKLSMWVKELKDLGLRPEIMELDRTEYGLVRLDVEDFWIQYLRYLGAVLLNKRVKLKRPWESHRQMLAREQRDQNNKRFIEQNISIMNSRLHAYKSR